MKRLLFVIPLVTFFSCLGRLNDPGAPIPTGNNFRIEFLKKINKIRSSGCKCENTYMPPVEPLAWNNLLELSAHGHARDMHRRNYFAHTSLSGKTIKNRIEDAGYVLTGMRTYAIGENIAVGQRSIDEVMRGWIKSEGHCKNIMSKNFKEIGVAEVSNYWVQDFGMRVSR